MNNTNAISFCELLHVLSDTPIENKKIVVAAQTSAKFNTIERLYIGSNFCSRYFIKYAKLSMQRIANLFQFVEYSNLKITLCVPIFSESYLKVGKSIVVELLKQYGNYIDEVTVNDYGMLEYIRAIANVDINIGRMMNKDTRDIRHDEYFNLSHIPTVSTLTSSVVSEYSPLFYELDITNRFIDLSVSDLNFALYFPYCFATVGNICEYAGISVGIDKKFRANSSCNFNCTQTSIDYENPYGDKYLKIGRAVYFKVDDFSIISQKPYRLVYEPFDMFKPGEQER